MDLEQKVLELRKRINNLRQQLTNDSDTSSEVRIKDSSLNVKGPAVSGSSSDSSSSEPRPSDAYKAKLMSKRSSSSEDSSSSS